MISPVFSPSRTSRGASSRPPRIRPRNRCLGRMVASAALLCLLAAPSVIGAQEAVEDQPKHVRLLTVGNSFTRNANRFLDELVSAAGHRLTHQTLVIGGSSLERHADMALAFERDREDPAARYADGRSLQQALQADDWDYVTIQQVSTRSHDATTYRPHASRLAEIVHRHAPGAELLLHQTWAYREDDPRFAASPTEPSPDAGERDAGEPRTREAMHRGLASAYATIGRELGARRIPVGDAFFLADNDPRHGFRPDPAWDSKTAAHPSLPDQTHSLHVGWRWLRRDGQWELAMDGHHANLAGEYLGGCVWLECLFGVSPVGNPFIPEGLDPDHARFLQTVAHRAVAEAPDAPGGWKPDTVPAFDDPAPQRHLLQARASELDPEAKEYPEIGFVFEQDGKPADVQRASVDTRVAPQGKLVIWLMGYNDNLFQRLNGYGLHAIQVSYANKWFGTLCRPQPADAYARGRVRLEAATGLDVSDELDLEPQDGAAGRALRLVSWLAEQHPEGRWDQFLTDNRQRLRWDKIILAGSSHGSTTAARFAKHQRVDRVVMLCGPRDQDQDWQALPSATPENRYFGFSHVRDGGWTGDHYCRSWELLGLHRFGPIVNVDAADPPYGHSRRLISDADVGGDAGRAHGAVTPGRSSPRDEDGNFLYEPVWEYLFNHAVDRVGEATAEDPDCLREHVR